YGNTSGLKANQIKRLENFYRRRIPPEFLLTYELARDLCRMSREIRRQIGILVNRRSKVVFVIVGDHKKIVIPNTDEYRAAPGRLKGLRCIHTHLDHAALTADDLTDLALLRLDLMAVLLSSPDGLPQKVHLAHIMPKNSNQTPYQILPPLNPANLDIDCLALIQALEDELARVGNTYQTNSDSERALLVSVSSETKRQSEESMAELRELALSGGIDVIGSVIQQKSKADSRLLIGPGKLQDLAIFALQDAATMIIFDQELNPSQIKSITDQIEFKVIDRTQLILDIFAQRAQTREGKLQVELAQLKYMLPRLVVKNTAMSRLTGGIGGRGPGETKLEINRRRARDRITRLEKALLAVRQQRNQQKAKRRKNELPVISIIGYTNAGKSTLLNTLTKSNVVTESRLFATLDPSSRRLRFPRDFEVIITDTVGFIRDLPKDLMAAFRATLEELESADLLLHIIDISNPRFEEQIKSVEKILADLKLHKTPTVRVLNKIDLVDSQTSIRLGRQLKGTAISAKSKSTLRPLMEKLETIIGMSNDE
ncbi:MAG: GTPase HflX, partial [Deltaproteobacteria bacterium]|nr:GTPase HflX [Deltaproteobacteria bacterium]